MRIKKHRGTVDDGRVFAAGSLADNRSLESARALGNAIRAAARVGHAAATGSATPAARASSHVIERGIEITAREDRPGRRRVPAGKLRDLSSDSANQSR